MVEHVSETQRLDVALQPIEMEIDHHFLKGAHVARETKIIAASLHSLLGLAGCHKWPVEKAVILQIPQGNFRISFFGNARFIIELGIVEDYHRIRIEDAPSPIYKPKQVALFQNRAGPGIKVPPPFSRPLRSAARLPLPGLHRDFP